MKKNTDHLPSEQIRKQLQHLEICEELKKSAVLLKILRFVVETTLEGKEEEIKEYTIGVKALGRPRDFNPQLDAIVRIHLIRLRKALAEYYSRRDKNDLIIITIPKGTYIPQFQPNYENTNFYSSPGRDKAQFIELPNTCRDEAFSLPMLAVLPFVDLSRQPSEDSFIMAIGDDLSLQLARFEHLSVISFYTTRNLSVSRDLKQIKMQTGADYILTGSVLLTDGIVKINVQLTSVANSTIIWSDSFFHHTATGALAPDTFDEIITRIANNVADEQGVINKMDKQIVLPQPESNDPGSEASLKLLYYKKQSRGFNRSVA